MDETPVAPDDDDTGGVENQGFDDVNLKGGDNVKEDDIMLDVPDKPDAAAESTLNDMSKLDSFADPPPEQPDSHKEPPPEELSIYSDPVTQNGAPVQDPPPGPPPKYDELPHTSRDMGDNHPHSADGHEGYENPAYKPTEANGAEPMTNGTHKPTANGSSVDKLPPPKKDKDEKEEEAPPMVGMKELFRFATGWEWFFMFLGTLCACLHGACLPCLLIVFGDMIDIFLDNESNATMVEMEGELVDTVRASCIYYVVIAAGVMVVAYGQITFWLLSSFKQTRKIREQLFAAILRQEIGWFDTHEPGELNTRMTEDVNKIQEGIGDKIGNFWQWFSTFLAGFIIGFIYGWKLTLVIMACAPLLAVSGGLMTMMLTSFTSKELEAYAKAGAVAEEVFSSIKTVTALGGQGKESERYEVRLNDARTFGIRKGMVGGAGMGMVFFIIFAVDGLAFWYGSKLVREEDHYTPGIMLIVFFCVLIGAFALGNAAPNLQNVASARGAAYTVYNIIDNIPSIDSSSTEGLTPEDITGKIEFKNVNFCYPSRAEVQVMQDFSLTVLPGQTVALVGSSGCGKSTSVQLLQRFYDPKDGAIFIDGMDITELNVGWLRTHLGVVSQEPILFGTTIKENIRYGRDDVTDEEIEQATKEANAYDFITKLPQKFETLVGERGAQMSGGQKQRIAIARALVRNPKILLLDEATSALDTESEAVVQAALDKASQGRTTIVIAHRLSTIKTADVIAGVDNGQVVELGTHDELMAKEGIYFTLATNQSGNMDEFGGDDSEDMAISNAGLSRKDSHARSSHRGLKRHISTVSQASLKSDKEKEEDLPEASVMRIMKMNSPETIQMILGCIGSIINGVIQPVFAILFAEIMAVFLETDLEEQKKQANFWSGMFVVLGVVQGISMFVQSYMFAYSGEALTMRLRRDAFKAYLRLEMAYFDDPKNSTGAITTRLATDAAAVHGATGIRIGSMLQSLSAILLGIGIGFYYSWELTLLLVAFVPFIGVAGMLQMKIIAGYSQEGQAALEGAGKVSTECIENIRTVATLGKEKTFHEKYMSLIDGPFKASLRKAHLNGAAFSFSQSLLFFAYAACFYLGAYLIEDGRLTFEEMMKVYAAIIFGAMAAGQASHFAPDYTKAKVAAARIFDLLDRDSLIDSASTDGTKPVSDQYTVKPVQSDRTSGRSLWAGGRCSQNDTVGEIEFKGVEFAYPTRSNVPVLRGLDLVIKPGQTLALVGSSGCGKSTTVQLLERFYDVGAGQVMMDGNIVTDLNIGWLRAQLGIVQQEPILFDRSIAENIMYGDNSRDVNMDEVIQAARDANIHNFIQQLPEGYETNVGDKGTQLSGGQKQRIAIARALVRNPKILLLDEATSALDTESEKVVQEALDRAQEGRTSIVIAHRLSTIQNADCIVVIHNGAVVEQGTHGELIAQQGFYFKLQQAQLRKR